MNEKNKFFDWKITFLTSSWRNYIYIMTSPMFKLEVQFVKSVNFTFE